MYKSLNVGVWNKGGFWKGKLLRKKSELELLLREEKIDILITCEANLTLSDINKMNITGYEIQHGTTTNNRVVIIYKDHLVIQNKKFIESVPTIVMEVKTCKEVITVIGTYREFQKWGEGPRTIGEETTSFRNYLTEITRYLRRENVIWGGDMNLDWNKLGQNDFARKDMLNLLLGKTTQHSLKMIVNENTRNNKKSTTKIDLIFVKGTKYKDIKRLHAAGLTFWPAKIDFDQTSGINWF